MSNHIVGTVYEQIIEDVISSSRVDFEENGVDEAVLDDLRKGWQRRLTQFNVAQFPWDPRPEPELPATDMPSAAAATASVPSPAPPLADNSFSQATMSPSSQGLPMPSLPMPSFDNGIKNKHNGIKMEADAQGGLSGVPITTPVPAPNVPPFQSLPGGGGGAAARAAQQLHQTFGQRAAASINAIHSGMSQQPQQQQRPGGNIANQQQYHQNGGANNLGNAQNDGANDGDVESQYEGVLLQKQKADQPPVELGRVEIDRMMHEQIAANAKQMEGGGLMMPMTLIPSGRSGPSSKSHKRKVAAGAAGAAGISAAAAAHLGLDEAQVKAMGKAIVQVDGAGDDDDAEVADEDAINSDLDDPDDNHDDDEDDEDAMSPIMLCVYDKVQRVKNKWKCTLKDGVLTVNGKEYLFHKANGEYEW
ncbi:transcription factor tfiia complex subunit [Ophiostoma piceae UAMH 11346]|uniref:Transcription initiation factor IIA large subunit n=1 Tax=Ophiostoma piceae (strain UAMH 11346) TaxID=1262450 RepID=S3D9J9_OPHP1|nr:transcription factor tfiia complex subunit [Ophiostoma piceae UAMH 11346]